MIVKDEFRALLPPLSADEFETLKKSILKEGIREPLLVWRGILVDGHNRYKIATELNLPFEKKEITFESEEDVKVWMIDNQKGRRNLTDGWKFELAQVKRELLLERGRERKMEAGQIFHKGNPKVLSTIDKTLDSAHNTRDTIAKDLGWSTGKTAMAEVVWKKAEPEVKEKIKAGEATISQVYKEIKSDEKKRERAEDIERQKSDIILQQENEPELNKRYAAIVLDPPWNYGRKYDPQGSRVANPYPEMTQDELKALHIPALPDATMYLWTTHQFIFEAKELMDHWGFEYKATIVWNKQQIGMGHWFRMQCEFCLFGIKGRPVWDNTTFRDIITEPRREHSRKPESFYKMVKELSAGEVYEFFSRTERDGFTIHGNNKRLFNVMGG